MSSVEPSSQTGSRENPRSMARSIASSMVSVGVDRDHVGTREHHLAYDGVAELEDRVDEPPFLDLDRVLLGRDVGHGADLLLGDERALLQTLAREHHVGDTDEEIRRPAQRREVGEEPQHRRDGQRGTFGVLHRERLRRHLADHEEQDDLQHDADDDAPRAGGALEQHTDERRRGQLGDEDEQQHDVEGLLGVFEHRRQATRPLVGVLLGQGEGPDAAHAHERGLGDGEPDRQHEEHDDDDQDRPVGTTHLTCPQPSSCRNRSSSSRSRRCIDSASRSSAWS